jgi:hypothetical protein
MCVLYIMYSTIYYLLLLLLLNYPPTKNNCDEL